MKINWLPFKEARSFVHKLKFKTVTQWLIYSKSVQNDLSTFQVILEELTKKNGKEWTDWLGTENSSDSKKSL